MISFPEFKVKKNRFSSGLRLVAIPVRGVKTLTLLAVVATGSNYENKKNSGISHFLEHMMFKGTEKRKTTKDISEELDSIGAEYNAFTSNEVTYYYIKAASYHSNLMFDVLSDVLLRSKFEEKEIEKERSVIVEEINMINDVPMNRASILFDEAAYGDQPAGRPIIGTKETIGSFSRKDFIEYHKKYYNSENTLIVASGDITALDAMKKTRKYFSEISRGERSRKNKTINEQKKIGLIIDETGTDQTHLILGFKSYDMFNPRRFATRILASVMGGNMSSRMFLDIRENRGLAYYVSTSTDSSLDSGMFYTRAGVNVEKTEEALSAILAQHREIKEKGITKKEMDKNKDYLISKMILGLETSDDSAIFFGRQEIFTRKLFSPKKIAQQIKKVTLEDIKKTANDLFVSQKMSFSAVGPVNKKRIKKILSAF